MALKIHGAEYALKDVFNDAFLFEIPPYQRPYSWTTEQASELLDDLLVALEENARSASPDPYFLGSIVLAKDDGFSQAQVIDGQQRLTTLTLLFAAIATRLEDGRKLWKYVIQEADEFAGLAEVPRLNLRPRDRAFFHRFVQVPGRLPELVELDAAQLSNDARRNLQANAAYFLDALGELPTATVQHLASYLLQHCYLIVVATPDSDSAFRIFAVLNDRGMDLTAADIIKNELIGGISGAERQETYTKVWEDAEEELGTERFGDLFAHIRMIYAKTKPRANLLGEFRQYVLSQVSDNAAFIDDVVAPYADIYARISTQSWESVSHAEEINELLTWLGRIDNFDWVPPAMVFLHRHRDDPAAVADFLRRLERLAAGMFIRRVGINPRIARYGRLLRELDDGVDVLAVASELDISQEEARETLDRLNGEVYRSGRPLRYVLLRLDAAMSAGGATYHHKIITVEHVLPQNPRPDSEWLSEFSEVDREHWTHRLANLVLLPRQKNSSASNYEFQVKKEKYFTGASGTSPFVLTTQVLEQDRWSPQMLARRQQELVAELARVWELEPAS